MIKQKDITKIFEVLMKQLNHGTLVRQPDGSIIIVKKSLPSPP